MPRNWCLLMILQLWNILVAETLVIDSSSGRYKNKCILFRVHFYWVLIFLVTYSEGWNTRHKLTRGKSPHYLVKRVTISIEAWFLNQLQIYWCNMKALSILFKWGYGGLIYEYDKKWQSGRPKWWWALVMVWGQGFAERGVKLPEPTEHKTCCHINISFLNEDANKNQ